LIVMRDGRAVAELRPAPSDTLTPMPLNIGYLDVSCHLVVSYSLFAL
jgi:hypothetical protein